MDAIFKAAAELRERLQAYEEVAKGCGYRMERESAVFHLTPINPPMLRLYDLLRDTPPISDAEAWDPYNPPDANRRNVELVRRVMDRDMHGLPMLCGRVSCAVIYPAAWENRLPSFQRAIEMLGVVAAEIGRTQADGKPAKDSPPKPKPSRKLSCNSRMLELLQQHPADAIGWSIREWVKRTGFAQSTIGDCQTWKDLTMGRLRTQAERATDRRAKSSGGGKSKRRRDEFRDG